MRIEPLNPSRHDRAGFCSGHAGLDEYLRRYAAQGHRKSLVRVYVAVDEADRVRGYYTLSAASVRHDELPEDAAKGLPKYPVPAVLIGRMAVDAAEREKGSRLGSRLLIHALKQALRAADAIGVGCVIVDAKSEAAGFYRKFGFRPLLGDGLKLYLPVGTVRRLADEPAA
jgi:predicted GNAT family N-acyltransferase